MANHKATLKSIRQTGPRTERNRALMSRIRTYARRIEDSITAKKPKEAKQAFQMLEPELMKGVRKNLMHINNASRKLSRTRALSKALDI